MRTQQYISMSIINNYILILILLFFASSSNVVGQTNEVDSLKIELKKELTDSIKIQLAIDISNKLLFVNYDSSLIYIRAALRLAEKNNSIPLIAKAQEYMGSLFSIYENLDSAMYYMLESDENYNQIGDTLGRMQLVISTMGNIYIKKGKYQKAEQIIMEAIRYFERTQDYVYISAAYNVLAISQYTQKDYIKALEYMNFGISAIEKIDKKTYDADITIQRNYTMFINNAGKLNSLLGNYEEAIRYYDRAVTLGDSQGQTVSIQHTQVNKANLYMKLEDLGEAIALAEGVYQFANNERNFLLLKDASEVLYQSYKVLGDYQSAFTYYEDFRNSKDSLFQQSHDQHVADLEMKYEVSKKEQENKNLLANNELNKKTIQMQRWVVIFFGGALLFVTVMIWMMYKNRKKLESLNIQIQKSYLLTEKANNELKTKSEELEKFNSRMLDREMRIIELKTEANSLALSDPTDPPYPEV